MKIWAVEVLLKRAGPVLASSLTTYAAALWATHQDFLESAGVTYYANFIGQFSGAMPTGHLIIIELDTFGAWAWAAIGALLLTLVTVGFHHTTAVVTGAPQYGGQRATDQ